MVVLLRNGFVKTPISSGVQVMDSDVLPDEPAVHRGVVADVVLINFTLGKAHFYKVSDDFLYLPSFTVIRSCW